MQALRAEKSPSLITVSLIGIIRFISLCVVVKEHNNVCIHHLLPLSDVFDPIDRITAAFCPHVFFNGRQFLLFPGIFQMIPTRPLLFGSMPPSYFAKVYNDDPMRKT